MLFRGEKWSACIQKRLIQHQGKLERTAAISMAAIKRDEMPGMEEGWKRKDEPVLLELSLASETSVVLVYAILFSPHQDQD